jgi:hypothetical protein
MPVELATPDGSNAPLLLYDGAAGRSYPLDNGATIGLNGFVNLAIEGPTITLDYRDINNVQLLAEKFSAAGDGSLVRTVVNNPGILTPPPAKK